MAFKPGKPKTGGRQKGTPNKKTKDLMEICEQEGIEPFRAMLRAYKEMEDPREQFDALEKIAQYLYPKRKAVEHSAADGEELGIKIIIEDYGASK